MEAIASRPSCCHCRVNLCTRSRGLCHRCSLNPDVRVQYPVLSKYGRRGVGNFNRATPRPPEPTDATPGSEEKLAVLEARAAAGQDLFHAGDPDVRAVPEYAAVRRGRVVA